MSVDRKAGALGALARKLPLLDWIPRATPGYVRPDHMVPVFDLVQRAIEGEVIRAVIHMPPRHAKSEGCCHGAAYAFARDSTIPQAWVSHTAALSGRMSRRIRSLTQAAGVSLASDSKSRHEWHTASGGSLFAVGAGGAAPGRGARILWCDDLIRSRAEAENAQARDDLDEWFRSSILPRLEPNASAFVAGHVWQTDELSMRLVREGWTHVVLPAISTVDGVDRALWPHRYDLDALRRIEREVGPSTWGSLYQCAPRPPGEGLFSGGVHFYEGDPPAGLRISVGLDLAYGSKTSADWTCAVVLGHDVAHSRIYVLDVVRKRQPIEATAGMLRGLRVTYPVAPRWYASGVERAIADSLRSGFGITIDVHAAVADKATRALRTSAAWARGEILLPRRAKWLDALVNELLEFPHGRHDDQTDALVAAYDALRIAAGGSTIGPLHQPGKLAKPWEAASRLERGIAMGRDDRGELMAQLHARRTPGSPTQWRPGFGPLPRKRGW